MERTTFASNFWVAPSKVRKNGLSPINLTITLNGEKASLSTHKQVRPENWDQNAQRVIGNSDDAILINHILDQIRNDLLQKEIELRAQGFIITAQLLRDAFQNKVIKLQQKTLFGIADEIVADIKSQVGVKISEDSYDNYSRAVRFLREYVQQKYHRSDMNLCELNHSFIENFDIFLRRQHNHKQNTAVKNVRCIKHIVSRAVMDGYLDSDPFAKYMVKREVVEKPFLTQEEIDRILAKDFHTPRLERVRDIFIFCCYTGLSYSDVLTLDRSHLSTDSKGRIWIKKRRVKTGVPFSVPLLPVPKLILDKYKGGDKLLPVIHISSCDEYLKEIAELCGIDKTVSFHTARYTFATTITISNRVSLEVGRFI